MEDKKLKNRLYYKTMLMLLIPAFLMIIVGYLLLPKTEPYYNDISINEAKILIDSYDEELLIIDVRKEQQFVEGHLNNSINIPLNEFEERLEEIRQLGRRKRYILVVGDSGNISAKASEILANEKFPNILNLIEDINEWDGSLEVVE